MAREREGLELLVGSAFPPPQRLCPAWETRWSRHLLGCLEGEIIPSHTTAVDHYLPRPRLGGKTAAQAWQERREGYDPSLRARLYAATCAAVERALQALPQSKPTLRARRRAERAAIWETLKMRS